MAALGVQPGGRGRRTEAARAKLLWAGLEAHVSLLLTPTGELSRLLERL